MILYYYHLWKLETIPHYSPLAFLRIFDILEVSEKGKHMTPNKKITSSVFMKLAQKLEKSVIKSLVACRSHPL